MKEIDLQKNFNKNIRFWMIFFKKNYKEKNNKKMINFTIFQKPLNKEFNLKNSMFIKKNKTMFRHLKN